MSYRFWSAPRTFAHSGSLTHSLAPEPARPLAGHSESSSASQAMHIAAGLLAAGSSSAIAAFTAIYAQVLARPQSESDGLLGPAMLAQWVKARQSEPSSVRVLQKLHVLSSPYRLHGDNAKPMENSLPPPDTPKVTADVGAGSLVKGVLTDKGAVTSGTRAFGTFGIPYTITRSKRAIRAQRNDTSQPFEH